MKTRILFIIGLILYALFPAAQPLRNLVFEGAGIRGIAYGGALQELERSGVLEEVERVGGTSAGAITALLISIGYNSAEVTGIINSTSFRKFNDGRFFLPGGIHRMQQYYGWYRGQQFNKWLGRLIEAKTGGADISFSALQHKGHKKLYVTGTCLNRQQTMVFSHESYPNMKVRDAVRISMSIPLYFEAVFLDSAGNIITRPKQTAGLDVMIDGGFTANYPLRIFDSTKYFDSTIASRFAINNQTLGFRIDSEAQAAHNNNDGGLAEIPIHNFSDYIRAFYTIILENLNRPSFTANDWKRTISISDGSIPPRIRRLSPEELNVLLHNGSVATKVYFLQK